MSNNSNPQQKIYIDLENLVARLEDYSFWEIKNDWGTRLTNSEKSGKDFSEVVQELQDKGVYKEIAVRFGENEKQSRLNPVVYVTLEETKDHINPPVIPINYRSPGKQQHTAPVQQPGVVIEARQEITPEYVNERIKLAEDRARLEGLESIKDLEHKYKEMFLKFQEDQLRKREKDLEEREARLNAKQDEQEEKQLAGIPEPQEFNFWQEALKGITEIGKVAVEAWVSKGGKPTGLQGETTTKSQEPAKPRERKKATFSVVGDPDPEPGVQEANPAKITRARAREGITPDELLSQLTPEQREELLIKLEDEFCEPEQDHQEESQESEPETNDLTNDQTAEHDNLQN